METKIVPARAKSVGVVHISSAAGRLRSYRYKVGVFLEVLGREETVKIVFQLKTIGLLLIFVFQRD